MTDARGSSGQDRVPDALATHRDVERETRDRIVNSEAELAERIAASLGSDPDNPAPA